MLRKVVSHPLFYLVLLGGCVALILSARSAEGGSWLGVWTSQKQVAPTVYQQKGLVDDSVIGVTMLHLELTERSVATNISFNQATELLSDAQAVLANNVVAYLQNASNKRLALQTYVKNVNKIVLAGEQVIADLQLDRETASQDYQQCAAEKTAADNEFFQGLADADGGLMERGLARSLDAGSCETKARISMNAYQAIIVRLQAYVTALTQLQTLLESNEDIIIANVDLFRDSYLERLIQIREQLRAYGGVAVD